MDNFFVHVVDETSAHVFSEEEKKYSMAFCTTESNKKCQINRSDCFYHVKAEDSTKAIAKVSKKILLKDDAGTLQPLSTLIKKTYKKLESASIDDSEKNQILSGANFTYSEDINSNLTIVNCQIDKESDDEKWIELHKIHFYVIQEKRMVVIK